MVMKAMMKRFWSVVIGYGWMSEKSQEQDRSGVIDGCCGVVRRSWMDDVKEKETDPTCTFAVSASVSDLQPYHQNLQEEERRYDKFLDDARTYITIQCKQRYGFILERQGRLLKQLLDNQRRNTEILERSLDRWMNIARQRDSVQPTRESRPEPKVYINGGSKTVDLRRPASVMVEPNIKPFQIDSEDTNSLVGSSTLKSESRGRRNSLQQSSRSGSDSKTTNGSSGGVQNNSNGDTDYQDHNRPSIDNGSSEYHLEEMLRFGGRSGCKFWWFRMRTKALMNPLIPRVPGPFTESQALMNPLIPRVPGPFTESPPKAYVAHALHSHLSSSDDQLSFVEGDPIKVTPGTAEKGWQYGTNMRTLKSGWFPIAFTDAEAAKDFHESDSSFQDDSDEAPPPIPARKFVPPPIPERRFGDTLTRRIPGHMSEPPPPPLPPQGGGLSPGAPSLQSSADSGFDNDTSAPYPPKQEEPVRAFSVTFGHAPLPPPSPYPSRVLLPSVNSKRPVRRSKSFFKALASKFLPDRSRSKSMDSLYLARSPFYGLSSSNYDSDAEDNPASNGGSASVVRRRPRTVKCRSSAKAVIRRNKSMVAMKVSSLSKEEGPAMIANSNGAVYFSEGGVTTARTLPSQAKKTSLTSSTSSASASHFHQHRVATGQVSGNGVLKKLNHHASFLEQKQTEYFRFGMAPSRSGSSSLPHLKHQDLYYTCASSPLPSDDIFAYGKVLERRLRRPEGNSILDRRSLTSGNLCGPWYDLWGVDDSVESGYKSQKGVLVV
ncbi:unnamed protein product [Cyprideis torosa]|uniref:Uncharacterized protein n=1 Tax=Cyprideis torosa TaxID=163714 RepID=A0A7R8WH73_9CRUS|nr:unnamed protein product [Cyprideis torosa]CAG0893836.1 unnamed protein product [Cyprideis torosa]